MKKNIRTDRLVIREYIISILIFSVIVFGFLIGTGTLTSGIHLIDDHEFFSIQNEIESEGVGRAYLDFVERDLQLRFRPLYWIERVTGVFLLGCRARLWSVCKAVEAVISMWLLYVFARKMQVGKVFSIWFSMMISIGDQAAVWWRLGPQESIGIILLGMALLRTYELSRKRNALNIISFLGILILMSLQKEAFMVLLPAMFILLMAFESDQYTGKFKDFFVIFIKKHIVEILVVIGILLTESYVILFKVGTDKLSYAGFSDQWIWKDYLEGIWKSLTNACLPYIMLLVIIIFVLQICLKREMLDQRLMLEILFCGYLLVIEQICYAKSSMYERYLIPWVIGIFYPVIIIGYRMIKNEKRVMVAEIGILSIFLLSFFKTAWTEALIFAEKGQQLRQCMDYIVENSSTDDILTSVSGIAEEDGAMSIIMQGRYGYSKCDDIRKYEENMGELKNSRILFGRYERVYEKINEAGLSPDVYDFYVTSNYEVAIKKSDE